MAENPEGVIMPTGAPASLAQGDVPEAVRRRYLTEGRGAQLAYYTDQTTRQPAFQDGGRRLSADRANPAVIKDMLAIAEHRGWSRSGAKHGCRRRAAGSRWSAIVRPPETGRPWIAA